MFSRPIKQAISFSVLAALTLAAAVAFGQTPASASQQQKPSAALVDKAGEATLTKPRVAPDTNTDGVAATPATNGQPDKSRAHFDYQLNPGQPAKDSIYVYNPGTTSQEVTLYARDAFTDAKGSFLVQGESDQPADVGSWVTFMKGEKTFTMTLKPHGYRTISFDVATPTNAGPGDHVGAIVVSAVTAGDQLNIVRRVAVRLYARLSGQISPRLEVSNLQISNSASILNPFDSTSTVSYDITNTGNVELAADVSVQPKGLFSTDSGAAVSTRVTNLLPGSKQTVKVKLNGLVQSGVAAALVTYSGVLPSNYQSANQPRGQVDVSSGTVPWAWIIWLALVVAVIVVWRIAVVARRNRPLTEQEHASID